ncbi:GGDEF domain-containing protein [Alteromonas mediterranea]|uniref:GGDEF domain-containing protein n=1 Tax=Alteromonas mediterranea TaxID=314275 RepID=UPI0015E82FD9|nr:GGDEF domain-containing protein [Alteromonas mediterranea]
MKEAVEEDFPCLLLKSDLETTEIKWFNPYAKSFLGVEWTSEKKIIDIVSKASSIFYESYIKPILLANGEYLEVQITLLSGSGQRVPAVANITVSGNILYWAIYVAKERDKLYQELIEAKDQLEKKTEELTAVSRRDTLTPLLNRRAANDDVLKMISQSRRAFVPLSFLLLDIDFFKKINDAFGHEEGDRILIKLSHVLLEQVRETDVVARWGGEEFLMVLFNTDIKDIKLFSERLHNAISEIRLPSGKPLTASIGGTVLEKDDLDQPNLIAQQLLKADKALYEAKANKRAHTRIYDSVDGIVKI